MSLSGTLTLRKRPIQAPVEAEAARSLAPAPSAPAPADSAPEPAWLAATRWFRTLPAFALPRRPLAIGIGREQRALAMPGAIRIGLNGNPVEPVADEHRAYAAALLEQRQGSG